MIRQRVVSQKRTALNAERRRAYTMSEAALAQRRANAPKALAMGALAGKSTGPVTEEGKAASSRNNWKHGGYSAIHRRHFGLGAHSVAKLFGKPCVRTCPVHPDNPNRTEAPCSLVRDGFTHEGGSCLDKTVFFHAAEALMGAMSEGNMDGMHSLLAAEVGSMLQISDKLKQLIADEPMVIIPAITHDGDLIRDAQGAVVARDIRMHPALAPLIRLTEVLGINFAELMATPRAREKLRDADEAADGFAAVLGAIAARAGRRVQPRTIEHDDADA